MLPQSMLVHTPDAEHDNVELVNPEAATLYPLLHVTSHVSPYVVPLHETTLPLAGTKVPQSIAAMCIKC